MTRHPPYGGRIWFFYCSYYILVIVTCLLWRRRRSLSCFAIVTKIHQSTIFGAFHWFHNYLNPNLKKKSKSKRIDSQNIEWIPARCRLHSERGTCKTCTRNSSPFAVRAEIYKGEIGTKRNFCASNQCVFGSYWSNRITFNKILLRLKKTIDGPEGM